MTEPLFKVNMNQADKVEGPTVTNQLAKLPLAGVLSQLAGPMSARIVGTLTFYADLADKFPFERLAQRK
jgi:hypothetical protein